MFHIFVLFHRGYASSDKKISSDNGNVKEIMFPLFVLFHRGYASSDKNDKL